VTRTRTGSPTATFGGFLVQGEGCGNITAANTGGGAWPLLALAALVALRRTRRD
jgi:MYXO-CTERM domain-containing protein